MAKPGSLVINSPDDRSWREGEGTDIRCCVHCGHLVLRHILTALRIAKGKTWLR
jgi:Zn ribbon nucleic-acid-binding protein